MNLESRVEDSGDWTDLPESLRTAVQAVHAATPDPSDMRAFLDRLLNQGPDVPGSQVVNPLSQRRRWLRLMTAAALVLMSVGLIGWFTARPQPRVMQNSVDVEPQKVDDLQEPMQPTASDHAEKEHPRMTAAFSPIWNVDHWSAERLNQSGITARPWKHKLSSEDPPLEWIQVAFDCSLLPLDQDVLLTAWFTDTTTTTSAVRAARSPQNRNEVTLLFTVRDLDLRASHVDVLIWVRSPDGGGTAHGYRLSMNRIIQLARETAAADSQSDK
jgi:hypothetical protein